MNRSLAALLAFALLAGCASDDDGDDVAKRAIRLHPLHAEPDVERGGAIVDAEDREVLLRGVNVNAFAEYWQANDFPTTFPFVEADADLIAAIGWNTVRLLLSWSRVEPAPGQYDEAYLDEIESAVAVLASRGIYTIIDLHQDAWGATLAARPDEVCRPPSQPAFGWDGAPEWATQDGGAARCTVLAEVRETSQAVRNAWVAFWNDSPGPDGVGIRTRYARMLGHVAERFATVEAVAGYDLMNEPNAFFADDLPGFAALYEESLNEIRSAEARAGGFSHLVLFEPSALWSVLGEGPPPDFAHDDNVVYAPHLYTGGFDNGPITDTPFATAREEAALFGGAPVLSGEWGSDPRRASNPDDSYFREHQRLQDDFHFSATLWTWRESCGDPHKAADYRAGRTPYVWGEFDVDCATNEIIGQRDDLVLQLNRAAIRNAPGRLDVVDYDPSDGSFTAAGSNAGDGDLVVFYPASHRGSPVVVDSDGLGEISEAPAPGGNVYVVAEVLDPSWSISLRP